MPTEPWVSVEDVAKHLGVAKDSIYRWIAGDVGHFMVRNWSPCYDETAAELACRGCTDLDSRL